VYNMPFFEKILSEEIRFLLYSPTPSISPGEVIDASRADRFPFFPSPPKSPEMITSGDLECRFGPRSLPFSFPLDISSGMTSPFFIFPLIFEVII